MQSRGGNTSQLLCFSIQGDANIHVVVYRLPRAQPGNRGSIERRPVGEALVVEDQGFTQQGPQVKLGHLEGHAFGCLLISTIRHCCPEKAIYYFIKKQNKRDRTLSVRCYSVLKIGKSGNFGCRLLLHAYCSSPLAFPSPFPGFPGVPAF